MYKIQFIYDGQKKRVKQKYATIERACMLLDGIQKEWSKNIMPAVATGQFDPNNATEVIRHSSLVLLVTTTGGHKLSWSVEHE